MARGDSKVLTRQTWSVVRGQPSLVHVVVRGVLLAGLAGLVLVVVGALLAATDTTALVVLGVAVIVVGVFASAAVWMVHAGTLAHAADLALRTGTAPSAREALEATRVHRRSLVGWAAITVTVGWLLSLLRGDGSGGGAVAILRLIGASALAAAWAVITFFAIPVIVLEGVGPVAAIKRSSHIVKERWGTQVGGNIRLGAVVLALSILPAIVLGVLGGLLASTGNAAGVGGGVVLIVAAVVLAIVGSVLLSALRAVFGVALYRFAEAGEAVGPYAPAALAGALRPRKA